MKSRDLVLTLAVLLVSCLPAAAATILRFEVAGTTSFSSTVFSYSLGSGETLSFTKAVDATSDDIVEAVATGTLFASAALIAYQDSVSTETEIYRYVLTDAIFASYSLSDVTENVLLQAATITYVPADVPTMFTFSVDGTTAFDTSAIHSYSFVPSGAGGTLTFTKDLDATSDDILLAVAQGTLFPGATFVAYDGVISPENEVLRYILSDILFTSLTLGDLVETVTIESQAAAVVVEPTPVPEPASGLLVLVGAALIARRRRRA
jgi:type VI protein secretion system component Hcp